MTKPGWRCPQAKLKAPTEGGKSNRAKGKNTKNQALIISVIAKQMASCWGTLNKSHVPWARVSSCQKMGSQGQKEMTELKFLAWFLAQSIPFPRFPTNPIKKWPVQSHRQNQNPIPASGLRELLSNSTSLHPSYLPSHYPLDSKHQPIWSLFLYRNKMPTHKFNLLGTI